MISKFLSSRSLSSLAFDFNAFFVNQKIRFNQFFSKICFVLIIILTASKVFGQAANYSFVRTSGTYTAITGGTLHAGSSADNAVYNFALGFNFPYLGTNYTDVRISTNGFLVLGTSAPSTTQYNPLSTLVRAISPFGRDIASGANYRSQVLGSAPNRVYVFQGTNVDRKIVSSQTSDNNNFQIRLYETTGVIEFHYSTMTCTATQGYQQVGITGNATSDYLNTTSTTSWSNFQYGTANTATMTSSSTIVPAAGTIYRFTPPVTSVAPTSITGVNEICAGGNTTLTSSGGTTGSDAVDLWYAGGCADHGYFNPWQKNTFVSGNNATTFNYSNSGMINVTSTSGDPFIHMPTLGSYNPNTYRYVNVRFRATSVAQPGAIEIFWYNSLYGGANGAQFKNQPVSSVQNQWTTVSIDMLSPTAGNWLHSNVTGWRFDWATTNAVTMEIDFISLSDRPIVGEGSSINFSPGSTTTYFTNKAGLMNRTTCTSQQVSVGPNIIQTGTLTQFGACVNTASANQTFTVSGTCLTANLVVTAPTGYQVSLSAGSGFASSVTLAPSGGTVSNTTIYARMAAAGSPPAAGNITCTSTGATTRNVAVSGTQTPVTTNAGTISPNSAQLICPGESIAFTGGGSPAVSFGNVTYKWYLGRDIGSGWQDWEVLGANPSLSAHNPQSIPLFSTSTKFLYLRRVYSSCGVELGGAQDNTVQVDIKPSPTNVSAGFDASVCSGGSVQLNGSATAPPFFRSFSELTGGGLTINASGNASVYPSTVNVSGLAGTISNIRVNLTNLTHSWPIDVDIVLFGPTGAHSIIMTDAIGGSGGISGRNYTFQIGATALGTSGFPASGTYGVVNGGAFNGLGTPSAVSSANLNNFVGTNPNGTWSLYVFDDASGDSGSLGSWALEITTNAGPVTYSWSPSTFLSATNVANPTASNVTSAQTYTMTATANGCSVQSQVNLNVRSLPAASATNNSPVCAGATVNLTASALAPGGSVVSMNNSASDNIAATTHSGVLNNHTIEFWVNPNRTVVLHAEHNTGVIANLGAPTTEFSFAISPNQFGGSGCTPANVGVGVSVGTNGIEVVQHGPCHFPVTLSYSGAVSGWTHVAVVHISNVPYLYVNGNLVKVGMASVYPTFPNSSVSMNYGYFGGSIDNIRVWNVSRTASQIVTDMNREVPSVATGLIHNLPLNGNGTALVGDNAAINGSSYTTPTFYTYTWSGLNAPSGTNETQTTGNTTGGNYTVVATSAGCSGTASAATTVTVTNPTVSTSLGTNDFVWTGTTSTAWNTTSNWLQWNGSAYTIPAGFPNSPTANVILPTDVAGTCVPREARIGNLNISVNNLLT